MTNNNERTSAVHSSSHCIDQHIDGMNCCGSALKDGV